MREFLNALDLDSETVDTIMAEHGKLITKDKEKIQQLQDELKKAKDDLKASGKDVDAKVNEALAKERKNYEIKMELKDKVHNVDITMSQLDLNKIVMDEKTGKIKSGLKEQLDDLKKSDGYLFISGNNGSNNNQNQNTQAYVKGATPKDGDGAQPTNLSAGELFAKNLAKGHNEAIKSSAESVYFGE